MKHRFYIAFAFISLLSISINVTAQKKVKLGKVSIDELKMDTYAPDSTAEAVILYEKRYYNIEYNRGFQLVTEVHRRIKILQKDAIDNWGSISFSLYTNHGKSQNLSKFTAYTFNLSDGKISSEKLTLRDAFRERTSEHYFSKKFSFKNVKVGSVIDYSYRINSDFFTRIPDLYFQYSIPLVWSELSFDYPEFYQYKYFVTGAQAVSEKKTTNISGDYTFSKSRDFWVFKDVPAMKQLSYMRPVNNYRTKVNYELFGVNLPQQPYKSYSTSWEKINHNFMESVNFGRLLDRLGPTKKIAGMIVLKDSSLKEKILAAVNYIQNNYQWNGKYGVYPSNTWKKNIREKNGSVADLNFTLIGILRNLNVQAYPVILSTRNNGPIFRAFPSTEDFNYIITAIQVGGKYILVDPSSEYTGLNILPERCLNGEGLLISHSGSKWIPIEVGVPYNILEYVNFKFDEDLNVTAQYQSRRSNYAGYFFRYLVAKNGGEKKFIADAIEEHKNYNISNYSISNLDDLSKPVVEKYTLNPEDYLQDMGDVILMKPVLFPNFKENPFKKEKRDITIDFKYPQNYTHNVVIDLPEGYAFDEIPKNLRVSTSDKSLLATVIYSVSGNRLNMLMKISIKKTLFSASRYEEIKKFFENVVAKENEQIVISEI